ncbi:Predicted protein (fragment) [Xanthomonas citri pv. fuscans]
MARPALPDPGLAPLRGWALLRVQLQLRPQALCCRRLALALAPVRWRPPVAGAAHRRPGAAVRPCRMPPARR